MPDAVGRLCPFMSHSSCICQDDGSCETAKALICCFDTCSTKLSVDVIVFGVRSHCKAATLLRASVRQKGRQLTIRQVSTGTRASTANCYLVQKIGKTERTSRHKVSKHWVKRKVLSNTNKVLSNTNESSNRDAQPLQALRRSRDKPLFCKHSKIEMTRAAPCFSSEIGCFCLFGKIQPHCVRPCSNFFRRSLCT